MKKKLYVVEHRKLNTKKSAQVTSESNNDIKCFFPLVKGSLYSHEVRLFMFHVIHRRRKQGGEGGGRPPRFLVELKVWKAGME